jgi:hypothetical protein
MGSCFAGNITAHLNPQTIEFDASHVMYCRVKLGKDIIPYILNLLEDIKIRMVVAPGMMYGKPQNQWVD